VVEFLLVANNTLVQELGLGFYERMLRRMQRRIILQM
jgi:hypothetical protein